MKKAKGNGKGQFLIAVDEETYDAIFKRACKNDRPLGKELKNLAKNNFNEANGFDNVETNNDITKGEF